MRPAQAGTCVEALLLAALPRCFPSKASVRRALRRGALLVDDTAPCAGAHTELRAGQHVVYVHGRPREHLARTRGVPPALQLEWAHVDSWLAACVKPSGIAVQGDESAAQLRHAVAWALPPPPEQPDALPRPRHAHRIDKATGGLLLFARTDSAMAALTKAFAAHSAGGGVRKTYLAIVAGRLDGSGVVDAPVHGKPSRSRWEALEQTRSAASGWVTTVRLHPETGRQHQLRRHLAWELGAPILGDAKYSPGASRAAEMDELYLWASEIVLPHPSTAEDVEIRIGEPAHFEARRRAEEEAATAATPAELAAAVERAARAMASRVAPTAEG